MSKLRKLDALRGGAAIYVVVYHTQLLKRTPIGPFMSLGPEAVMLFFILSGFVIHYSSASYLRQRGFANFFMRRFKRIYPLFIISLFMGYLGACIDTRTFAPFNLANFVGNLFMLQDVVWLKKGAWCPYFYNLPVWSLGYEWWFYMLFFPISVSALPNSPWSKRIVLAGAVLGSISYLLEPNQPGLYFAYFFIWWAGVEMSKAFMNRGVAWSNQLFSVIGLAILSGIWAIPVVRIVVQHEPLLLGYEPMIEFRHFAAALTIVIGALIWNRLNFWGFDKLLGPLAVLAPISYSLYIFHHPFMIACSRLPWRWAVLIYIFGLIPFCAVAELIVQPGVNKLIDKLLDRSKGMFGSRSVKMTCET